MSSKSKSLHLTTTTTNPTLTSTSTTSSSPSIENLFQTLEATETQVLMLLHRVKQTLCTCKQLHQQGLLFGSQQSSYPVQNIEKNATMNSQTSPQSASVSVSSGRHLKKAKVYKDASKMGMPNMDMDIDMNNNNNSHHHDDNNNMMEEIEVIPETEKEQKGKQQEENYLLLSLEESASNYLSSVWEIRDRLIEFGKSYIPSSYIPYQSNCYVERTRVEVLEMVLANYQTRLAYLKEKKKQKNQSDLNTKVVEEAN